jgi:heat-inducible transcriptional repressor
MNLDDRQDRILQAIVNEYVTTAEPVGSEWLVTRYDFGCKSATIRNEMAAMSERGYLVQPHTSAGRIPSTRGYRYYVDRLMPAPAPRAVPEPFRRSAPRMEVEEIVQLSCRTLSDMAQYPSIATTPLVQSTLLHRLYVSPASARHVLVVLLFSTGHVEHRVLEVSGSPGASQLDRISGYLNERLAGKELEAVTTQGLGPVAPELAAEQGLLTVVYRGIADAVRALADNKVFLEGTSHILRQREFQDVLRLEHLLSVLHQRSVLFQVFSRGGLGEDVTVIIGSENQVEEMADCSVVSSPYKIGSRTAGFIGVVGPTRMDYDRAVSAVGTMARSLSSLLTKAMID